MNLSITEQKIYKIFDRFTVKEQKEAQEEQSTQCIDCSTQCEHYFECNSNPALTDRFEDQRFDTQVDDIDGWE